MVRELLPKGEFIKNASILTMGSVIAQLVPFIVYPLIGRLYTPEQAAVLAAYTSLVSIIQVVSTFKYEGAILLAKNDVDAANLATLASLICGLICLVITIPIAVCPSVINSLLKTDIGNLLILIPVSVFSISVFEIYNEWCVRNKYYKKLAVNKISNAVTVNGGKVGAAFTPFLQIGLVIGDVFGRFLTCAICLIRVWLKDKAVFKRVTLSGIKKEAIEFNRFPKYIVPGQLLNTLGASLPILIMGIYFTGEDIGLFSMALAIMYVPISVVGRSVRDVFRKKVRDSQESSDSIFSFMRNLFGKLVLVSVLAALSLVWFLPTIFSFFLGDKWLMTGIYAQILTPLVVINFISTGLDGVLLVAKKYKHIFIWQLLFCFCSVVPVFIGGCFDFSFKCTVWIYCIFRIIPDVTLIYLSFRFAGEMDQKKLK